MQAVATGILALMAVVFVAASLAVARWPAAAWLRAFAEAALVGGFADWFAVSALFRHPLGLPIPHTAIIPRNKDRIGDALGQFIVDNFLSARVLDARLKELELAAWGGAWLQQPKNARSIAEAVLKWGPQVTSALPAGALEELAASVAAAAVKSAPVAPAASALLAALWNQGGAQPLIERCAELAARYLSEHQEVILERVQAQSWRWMPGFVDRAIARRVTGGLVELLEGLRRPDHPWRAELALAIETLIERLAKDPELRRQGEALKQQLLDDPRLQEHAHVLWSEIGQRLAADWADGLMPERIERLVRELGRWLAGDAGVQRSLNTAARALARQVLMPRRDEIGRYVAQVVKGWDARAVVARLELQVGPDLQYIRINGAIVGGLVGLVLYALGRLAHLA